MIHYKQCVLRKQDKDNTVIIQVSWIPEQYAHKGHFVKLRNKKDRKDWDDGWQILSESRDAIRLEEEQLLEYESDHKHQREASDI